MAYYEQPDFRRPASTLSTVDRKSSTLFDDFSDIDAPTPILASATTMSPTFSEDPFTTSFDEFSAVNSDFNRPLGSNNPFFNEPAPMQFNNNNPYRASMPAQQQAPSWSVPETPTDASTPTATSKFDPFGSDFDPGPSAPFMSMSMSQQQPYESMSVGQNVRPSAVFPSASDSTAQPMSPHTNKEWMEMSQSMEPRGPPRHMMRSGSSKRAHSPNLVQRSDGVRKKNARFEIPPERSLLTIDQLISSCQDGEQLKELKQQKRLLRNRQAAYEPLSYFGPSALHLFVLVFSLFPTLC
jgi:hypothetical protein